MKTIFLISILWFLAASLGLATPCQKVLVPENAGFVQQNPDSLLEKKGMIERDQSFINLIKSKGVKPAREYYQQYIKQHPHKQLFFEESLNDLGYYYLESGKTTEAIEIFKLNMEAYPKSFNVYDSLGEAYLNVGNKEEAIKNYHKSLQLNPENENAKAILKKLDAE